MYRTATASEKYALLGQNRISIESDTDAESELYQKIKFHFGMETETLATLKDNRFQLCVLAASIRNRYLNKTTNKYTKTFHDWYQVRKLNTFFGSFSYFTQHAGAGDVVNSVVINHEADLEKLPSVVSVLYRIQLLMKEIDHPTFLKLFVATPRRKSRTDKDLRYDEAPLIHPDVTEEAIKNWLVAWKNPARMIVSPSQKKMISVPVATIFVSKELYAFNSKTGDHVGVLDLEDLKKFMKGIEGSFSQRTQTKFRLESNMKDISTKYETQAKHADPAEKTKKRLKKLSKSR